MFAQRAALCWKILLAGSWVARQAALSSCVTLGKFLDLSERHFSHLQNQGSSSPQDCSEQSEKYWV